MLIGVISYFLLATAVLALVFLPPLRAWLGLRAQRIWASGRAATHAAAALGEHRARDAGGTLVAALSCARRWLLTHWRGVVLSLTVIAGMPLLALALHGWHEVGGFDHTVSREINPQVAALLAGEQLVPPPALPPELFLAREVEQARPLIRDASRQWELLDADFRQRLLVVFKLMQEKHGYEMVLLEGYRSPERQSQLAALGPKVTQAGAFESYHQFGLAADCAFLRGGRIVIAETDPWAMRGYEIYGEVARSAGLVWGGDWRSLKDFGHVELRRAGTLGPRVDNANPASGRRAKNAASRAATINIKEES